MDTAFMILGGFNVCVGLFCTITAIRMARMCWWDYAASAGALAAANYAGALYAFGVFS